MSLIKPIDKTSVHKICSGQVVLDLATAVKELVENSLDAESKNIEIKLKEYGSSLIEVSDDGSGVEEKNYEGLTLKHHTSKISDFDDLTLVSTFGFRGEALSSLCALCDLTITTRHKDALVGHKIKYNHGGAIVSKTQFARLPGTTVSLQNIFSTLPVRYKEFQKHVKREYKKLLSVINAYCVISEAKIICMNQNAKGKRTTVVSTQGSGNMFDNITSVFGRHEAKTLIKFKQEKPTEEVCEMFLIKHQTATKSCELYNISGYISGCTHGRNSCDRQLFYINNRPCDLPKLSKVVNSTFHIIDRHHYPFVVLNISVIQERVDVNVTPDKRQIFLEDEKVIFAIIRTSLLKMYTNSDSHDIGTTGLINFTPTPAPVKKSLMAQSEELCKTDMTARASANNLQGFTKENSKVIYLSPQNLKLSIVDKKFESENESKNTKTFLSQFQSKSTKNVELNNTKSKLSQNRKRTRTLDSFVVAPKEPKLENEFSEKYKDIKFEIVKQTEIIKTEKDLIKYIPEQSNPDKNIDTTCITSNSLKNNEIILDTDLDENIVVKSRNLKTSISILKNRIYKAQEARNQLKEVSNEHVFSAKIDPSKNSLAETELTKNLSKDTFSQMKIIGQFNLGFIIASHKQDVFIIDQHATDEKYNFEMLQKHSVLKGQRLIAPQKLEITPGDLMVLEESMNIFEKNGFEFEFKEDNDNKTSAFLVSVPGSLGNSYSFGSTDVLEMIFMLNGMPGIMCRPSRIRQMFASKACRKSIMIGSSLSKVEMERLVQHMGEMDQPWNCPHGRPTMRHLVDLNMIKHLK